MLKNLVKLLLLVVLCCEITSLYAQEYKFEGKRNFPELDDVYGYDALHYTLNIDLRKDQKRDFPPTFPFLADLTMTAKAENDLDKVILDAYNDPQTENVGIKINKIFWLTNQDKVEISNFSHTDHRLFITPPQKITKGEEFKIQIYYQAKSEDYFKEYDIDWAPKGLFVGEKGGDYVVESSSQCEGARLWWPCKDKPNDKATANINITTKANYLASSNGLLVKEEINGDAKTFYWQTKYPMSTYLLTVNAGPYELFMQSFKSVTGKEIPIYNYLMHPDGNTQGQKDKLATVPEMMAFLESKLGPYPFQDEKYGSTFTAFVPGMEHQTISSLGYDVSQSTVYHELTHQWLGDKITCDSWGNAWLNEGMTTFVDALIVEFLYGRQYYLDRFHPDYWFFLTDPSPLGVNHAFDSAIYNKGALVMHILRTLLGDELFFATLKKYVTEYPSIYGNVNTAQFIAFWSKESGADLTQFAANWLEQGYYPELKIGYNIVKNGSKFTVTLTNKQIQEKGSFKFDFPILITLKDGTTQLVKLYSDDKEQTKVFEFNSEPANWKFNYEYATMSKYSTYNVSLGDLPSQDLSLTAYPNPFNNRTSINFNLVNDSQVNLQIYNTKGEVVYSLASQKLTQGSHLYQFDASSLNSGLYFVVLKGENFVKKQKIVLVK